MATLTGKRVYITRNVPTVGVDLLKAAGIEVTQWESDDAIPKDELLKGVKDVDGIFCLLTDKIDKAVLDAAGPKLKVVATMSVGYEHLDLFELKTRGIKVAYDPDISTDAVAELGVALLLSVSRRILEGNKAVMSGEWKTWRPLWLCGSGLAGSTVGIVGLGRIGMGVAKRLTSFKVARLLYFDQVMMPHAGEVGAEFVQFETLLKESDYIIAVCPLTSETKEMFNKERFAMMKKTAIFVNIGRSGVVNQEDLYEALKNGEIRGVGLDVTTPEPLPPTHPMLTLPNCVVVPHIGSSTIETRNEMAKLTAENIIAALAEQPMKTELKF